MNLARVLSLCAIILGIYILLTFLLGGTQHEKDFTSSTGSRDNFHVGCYLNDHNVTQYDHILLKIQQLKDNSWIKQQRQYQLMPNDVFEKRGVQVARNFQSFISQYNNFKSLSQVNNQLSRTVINAYNDFRSCTDELKYQVYFSKDECIRDWEAYLSCSTDLQALKSSLKLQLEEKANLNEKTKALLDNKAEIPQKLSNPQHQDNLKQFRRKDKKYEEDQRRLQIDLKLLYQKISQAQFNASMSEKKSNNARFLYLECSEHRIQFRLCQQLTRQMLTLGHGSIEAIGSKVERKRVALTKIQNLLNQNGGRDQVIELKKLYLKYLDEFKKLLSLFIETKAKIKKHCGCTEAEEKQLKLDLEQSLREYKNKVVEYQRYKDLSSLKAEELNKVKEARKRLLQQLDPKMNKVSRPQPKQKSDLVALLGEISLKMRFHEEKIRNLEQRFKSLESECEQKKSRLSSKVISISKIKDCLNKYQYYSQIKLKADREAPKQSKMSEVQKRKMVQSVKSFVF